MRLLLSQILYNFQKLVNGEYGNNAYENKNFFVFCGAKDEEWQDKQCHFMKYSKEIVEKFGGKIVGDIADPNGKHMGLRLNNEYHERAIKKFIKLTSE